MFKERNLNGLAYANRFTIWHYSTKDEGLEEVRGYLVPGDLLRAGDLVLVNAKGEDGFVWVQDGGAR